MAYTIVLLGFCFALASSSAAEGLMSLQTYADEARSILSTLPEECTKERDLVAIEQAKALYSIFNCSYADVIDGIGNVALEAATYAVLDYSVISKLVIKFSKCAADLIDPLKVIECDYNELESAYSEIESMITSTANFISDMKELIPPLKQEIENCFEASTSEYKLFLNKLIQKARICNENL